VLSKRSQVASLEARTPQDDLPGRPGRLSQGRCSLRGLGRHRVRSSPSGQVFGHRGEATESFHPSAASGVPGLLSAARRTESNQDRSVRAGDAGRRARGACSAMPRRFHVSRSPRLRFQERDRLADGGKRRPRSPGNRAKLPIECRPPEHGHCCLVLLHRGGTCRFPRLWAREGGGRPSRGAATPSHQRPISTLRLQHHHVRSHSARRGWGPTVGQGRRHSYGAPALLSGVDSG